MNFIDALEGFVEFRSVAPPSVFATYGALTDAFSILAIIGVVAFVLRRFFLKSRRDFLFNRSTLLDESVRHGYIQRDSLIVSVFIVFHVGSRIVGNAGKLAISGPEKTQPFSSFLAHAFAGQHALAWRIFGYWGALGSVLLFLVYFPYSKHVHLIMAPLKYFFRREAQSGELPAVKIDLDAAEPQVGADKLADLAWPRLLDAYACIQCNRCQDVCPATQTGKALSPAALEINKRMVLNRITGQASALSLGTKSAFELGTSSGPSLLEAVISPESVWACTTCGACMEVCPTQNEQMLDIIDIRRNMVMLQGEFPAQLGSAFRGMERAGNPWGISRDKRMTWAEGLRVPTIDEIPDPDVLYWVGCAASYDPGAQKTARAVVHLLTEGNVKFAVLGKRESCTGDSARRAGNELLYQELAAQAIETLNQVQPKLLIASCPHCVNIISTEFPQFGGQFQVMHHTEFLASMLDQKKLTAIPTGASITFHDPCYLGRHRGTYEQPRSVLKILTNNYVELDRSKNNSFCCGAGGAQFWKEEERGDERISEARFKEVQQSLDPAKEEKVLAVGCPFCKSMLQSTPSAGQDQTIAIKDVAELLWEAVQLSKELKSNLADNVRNLPLPHSAGTQDNTVPEPPAVSLREDMPVAAQTTPSTEVIALPSSHTPSDSAQAMNKQSPEPIPEPLPVSSQSPERKKWSPKSASPSASPSSSPHPGDTLASGKNQPSETTSSQSSEQSSPPVRRKWQPTGKDRKSSSD